MDIEYLPSAYLLCCESGHEFKFFGEDLLMCERCGLTPEQVQRLTIGDNIPKAIVGVQQ